MRILIDLTQIAVQRAGVGVYADNLVANLLKVDVNNEYILLVQDDDEAMSRFSDRAQIVQVNAHLFRWLPFRFALEQLYIPYLVVKYRIDLVHSLHYSFPLFTRAKRVVTIHDLTSFLFPELHIGAKAIYYRWCTRLAVRMADAALFDSQASLDDCIRLLGVPSAKTSVVYLGVNGDLRGKSCERGGKNLKGKYGIKDKYFLFVGMIEPRKNLVRLVLAFERLLSEGFEGQLVIAGKRGWHCDELDGVLAKESNRGKIICTGYVTDEEKINLLHGAFAFVYPSLYEGFGIPVLESLAMGLPTITSNVSSLPEVAGDAALLVDPTDVTQLYVSMWALVRNRSMRERLKVKALERSQTFTWSATANRTREMYEYLIPEVANHHAVTQQEPR